MAASKTLFTITPALQARCLRIWRDLEMWRVYWRGFVWSTCQANRESTSSRKGEISSFSLFFVLISLPRTVRFSCASRREKSSKERLYLTNSCLSFTLWKRFLSNRSLIPHNSQQFIGTKTFGLYVEGLDKHLTGSPSALKSLYQHDEKQSWILTALSTTGNKINSFLPHLAA